MKIIVLYNTKFNKIYNILKIIKNNKLLNQKATKIVAFNDQNCLKVFKKTVSELNKSKVIIFDNDGFKPFLFFSKQKGVCCSYPLDKKIAKLSIEHNNAHLMVLPLEFINLKDINIYINNFLKSSFEGGRHKTRIDIMLKPWKSVSKPISFEKTKKHKIVIACDHAAVDLKLSIIKYLLSKGYDVVDVGTDSNESTVYSMYAIALGLYAKHTNLGIALCGSGIGISNTVNKFKGLRCCLCNNPKSSTIARTKYGANVLAMGARFISTKQAYKTIDKFLSSKPKTSLKGIDALGFGFDKPKFKQIAKNKGLVIPSLLK